MVQACTASVLVVAIGAAVSALCPESQLGHLIGKLWQASSMGHGSGCIQELARSGYLPCFHALCVFLSRLLAVIQGMHSVCCA